MRRKRNPIATMVGLSFGAMLVMIFLAAIGHPPRSGIFSGGTGIYLYDRWYHKKHDTDRSTR